MNDLSGAETFDGPSDARSAMPDLARRALREALAGETRGQAKRLTRDLVLARLAMPGADSYLDREERLFDGLIKTGWILSKALKMGAGDHAEDVQQRVLLRLMIDFREGRLYAIRRGYVETTVGFDIKTQWRKAQPASLSEEAEFGLAAPDEFPDSELAEAEAKLERVWNGLSDAQRQVLLWRNPQLLAGERDANGEVDLAAAKTLKEIGEAWGKSTATIHRLEAAAAERLLAGLREEGLEDLADLLAKRMM